MTAVVGTSVSARRVRRLARGYTYLGLLFAVALSGAALAKLAVDAQGKLQREREAELVFRGGEIRRAIDSYVRYTPTGQPVWPLSLSDLLVDRRGPTPRHHLRRLYLDPFTRAADWELLPAPAQAQGFAGVRSRAMISPMSWPAAFAAEKNGSSCVCNWPFVADRAK